MARRINGSTMGLQMYPIIIKKRIPFQSSIRCRGHDTGRNWRTISTPRTIRPGAKPLKHVHLPRPPIWI